MDERAGSYGVQNRATTAMAMKQRGDAGAGRRSPRCAARGLMRLARRAQPRIDQHVSTDPPETSRITTANTRITTTLCTTIRSRCTMA